MARRGQAIRDIRANALDKASESNKMSKVYTTEKINQILEDIKKGKKPDLDPFYHGKKDLRDTGITFQRTPEEDEEYKKCAMDIIYFVSRHAQFKTRAGYTLVTLRDYQEDTLHMLGDEVWDEELQDIRLANRRIILMQSRQSAKCFTMDTELSVEDTQKSFNYSQINKKKYSLIRFLCQKLKESVKYVEKHLLQKVKKLYIVLKNVKIRFID